MLPKLFIGSSNEALSTGLVEGIREALDRGLNATAPEIDLIPWNASPWENMEVALRTLVDSLADYSFAVFILSADDELTLRGQEYFSARDNVIFEFGVFLAHLGSKRTFLVGPKENETFHVAHWALGSPPPTSKHLPLRIFSDLGSAYRKGSYEIRDDHGIRKVVFNVEDVVAAIRDECKLSAMTQLQAQRKLAVELHRARGILHEEGRGDAYYSGQFFSRFRDMATLKAKATSKTVQQAVQDLLLYLERVPDLCDIEQLAEDQHFSNGINEVWVFSDSPLEFRAKAKDEAFEKLRDTIRANLAHGVRYHYFVGPTFDEHDVDHLVDKNDPHRGSMLSRISVIKVHSQFFSTYFTLHFAPGTKGPKAIYMSSVMHDRRDLLIQVSDHEHVARIYNRISVLRGELVRERSPRITNFVLRPIH